MNLPDWFCKLLASSNDADRVFLYAKQSEAFSERDSFGTDKLSRWPALVKELLDNYGIPLDCDQWTDEHRVMIRLALP